MATSIRPCTDDDRATILEIVNEAAQRYRGVIPDDRWHDPYMPSDEYDAETAAGVRFYGFEDDGRSLGVMGIQDVGDVTLIRHAYVRAANQGRGVGGALLAELRSLTTRPVLIGTWATASWAVDFYRKHGFELVTHDEKERLLRTYWSIPERQVATSVVLADATWFSADR